MPVQISIPAGTANALGTGAAGLLLLVVATGSSPWRCAWSLRVCFRGLPFVLLLLLLHVLLLPSVTIQQRYKLLNDRLFSLLGPHCSTLDSGRLGLRPGVGPWLEGVALCLWRSRTMQVGLSGTVLARNPQC